MKQKEFKKLVDKVHDIQREHLYSQDNQAQGQLGKEALFMLLLKQDLQSHLRSTMPDKFRPEAMSDEAFKKIRAEHEVEGIPSGMMISILEDIHRNSQTEEGWVKNLEYFVKYL